MKNLFLVVAVLALAILVSCSDSDDPIIDCEQSDLSVTIVNTTLADCDAPGTIEAAGSGGTAPYMFSIDGSTFQTSTTLSDLSAGLYTVTISDANGCTAEASATVDVGPNGILLTLTPSDTDCGDDTGSIDASATGGDGNFTFSIDGGTPSASGQFNNLESGRYTIVVTDGTGCTVSKSVELTSDASWASDIRPIINANCAISGCHNGSNSSLPNWSNLSEVQSNASSIKSRTGARSMPPAGSGKSLSDAEIELIACWVDDGANDN